MAIEFNHSSDSYIESFGVSEQRSEEMRDIFSKHIPKLMELGTKSMMVETMVALIQPVNDAELFVLGSMFGLHDAAVAHSYAHAQQMKEKYQSKQNNMDDA